MLALKLSLVAASVLLASLAARRFGHTVAGALAGMPMIAAPITVVLLIDYPVEQVRAIVLATLACVPAAVVHITTFARCAVRASWPVCLASAAASFLVSGLALMHLSLPPAAVCALAAMAPGLGLVAMPSNSRHAAPVSIPPSELALRMAAAVGMAAAIVVGAGILPPSGSGLLLAVPITGSVLPCFTLPRHGAAATASLLAGFARGLHGFVSFFITLYVALPSMGRAAAFTLALGVALVVALLVYAARRGYRST